MDNNNINPPQYSEQYSAPVVKEEKPAEVFDVFDGIIGILMLFFGYGYIKLVIAPITASIGAACFFTAFLILGLVFMKRKSVKLGASSYILFAILLIFSMYLGYSGSIFLKTLSVLFIIGGTIYWVYASSFGIKSIRRGIFYDFLTAAFTVPFSNYGACAKSVGSITGKSKGAKNGKYVLIGLVITVPVTAIIAVLLSSSDLMFENLMDTIFSDSLSKIFLFFLQFAVGIPISFYLYGMLRGGAKANERYAPNDEKQFAHTKAVRFINPIVFCSAVTPICILYLLYFIAQSGYFLSAFSNLLPDGFSYAEYARRGFFELFVVTLINLATIGCMLLFSKRNEDKVPVGIKFFTITISVFTLLLIATALSKMVMYIGAYGLTQLRVYTSWFMILLALIMLCIILCTLFPKLNPSKIIIYTFIVMFGVLCFSDVDAKIAQYNVNDYQSGALEEVDIGMFYDLSPSAAEYVLPLLETSDEGFEYNRVVRYLSYVYEQTETDDLRTVNYSDCRIHSILEEYEVVRNYAENDV